MEPRWRPAAVVVVLALAGAALLLLARVGWDVRTLLSGIEAANPWLFLPAMALLPVVGLPIAPFYVFAGLAFPFSLAVAICWTALAVNISLSYWVARSMLAGPLLGWLERRGHRLPVLSPTNQFRVTFLMRAVPGPPFVAQNYLLSLAGIPFATYFWVSWLTQGVLATGVVWLSDRLGTPQRQGEWLIAAALVGLLLAFKLVLWLRARTQAPAVAETQTAP